MGYSELLLDFNDLQWVVRRVIRNFSGQGRSLKIGALR